MERLTYQGSVSALLKSDRRTGEYNGVCFGCRKIAQCTKQQKYCNLFYAIKKLAAYEDTGLTPEETQKYRELENRLKDIYGDHNDLLRYTVEGLEIYRLARSKAIILTDDDVDRWNAYKSIGPVKECREAVEKQRAKKPNLEGDGYADGHMVYDTWICPYCGISYEIDYDDYKYCPDCGQHIDWSE